VSVRTAPAERRLHSRSQDVWWDLLMLNGNMVAGASKCGVLVRVGKDRQGEASPRVHNSLASDIMWMSY